MRPFFARRSVTVEAAFLNHGHEVLFEAHGLIGTSIPPASAKPRLRRAWLLR